MTETPEYCRLIREKSIKDLDTKDLVATDEISVVSGLALSNNNNYFKTDYGKRLGPWIIKWKT